MDWHDFLNNTLPSLLGGALLSFIIGCIIAAIISMHIEKYCTKIGIEIGEQNPTSLFGLPQPAKPNRKALDKHMHELSLIYTAIVYLLFLFKYFT